MKLTGIALCNLGRHLREYGEARVTPLILELMEAYEEDYRELQETQSERERLQREARLSLSSLKNYILEAREALSQGLKE